MSTLIILLVLVVPTAWFLVERSHRKTSAMAGGLHEDITLPHTAEWELYHNSFSLCSKKLRVCLDELGLEYASWTKGALPPGGVDPRPLLVASFLAILELARLQALSLYQGIGERGSPAGPIRLRATRDGDRVGPRWRERISDLM